MYSSVYIDFKSDTNRYENGKLTYGPQNMPIVNRVAYTALSFLNFYCQLPKKSFLGSVFKNLSDQKLKASSAEETWQGELYKRTHSEKEDWELDGENEEDDLIADHEVQPGALVQPLSKELRDPGAD